MSITYNSMKQCRQLDGWLCDKKQTNEVNKMEEQNKQENITNWLDAELAATKSTNEGKTFEKLPTVLFTENKIATLEISFDKPFEKWTGESRGRPGQVTKAIISCLQDGVLKNWWLNIKNPCYAEVIKRGRDGQRTFKVLQVGTLDKTMYKIID